MLGWLPPRLGAWLGGRFGDVLFLLASRRRRLALENLRTAFPSLSREERRRLCRRSWEHLGTMLFELCAVLSRPLAWTLERISMEGREHLERVVAAYGRALIVTGHLGNWELLTVAHHLTGYPLTIVVRPLDSRWLNGLAERLRRKAGVELVAKRGALRPLLAALRRGGLVAILLDQNAARRESVFVPFFGRPASTSKSLALLATRTETPVVPIFIRREAHGRHRVVVHPPLLPAAGQETGQAVLELTRRCTEAIEAAIREAPDQWLWVHNRWRTRPAGDERGTTTLGADG